MKQLPKTIYVKIEKAPGESYLVATANKYSLADQGEKTKIGTYQLVETETAELVLKTQRVRG